MKIRTASMTTSTIKTPSTNMTKPAMRTTSTVRKILTIEISRTIRAI